MAAPPRPEKVSVRNVSGSTAGAGSGDFHQYRNYRRAETFRLEAMEKQAKKLEEVQEFLQVRVSRQKELDEKQNKKAAKRKRLKEKRKESREKKKARPEGAENTGSKQDTDEPEENLSKGETEKKGRRCQEEAYEEKNTTPSRGGRRSQRSRDR